MSFLESAIDDMATKLEIEKEMQRFGSEPCMECGYYHGDEIDHTGEGDLMKKEDEYYRTLVDAEIDDTTSSEGDLTEEEMKEDQSYGRRAYCEPDDIYYFQNHYDDDEDSTTGEEEKKNAGGDDDDDDDTPELKLNEGGIGLGFTQRVKPDMPNGYISGKKLDLRNRYRKEATDVLELLVKTFLANHKKFFKSIYTSIRDCEDDEEPKQYFTAIHTSIRDCRE